MTPAAARDMYRRHLSAHGETISLVRGFGGVNPITVTGLRARVKGYEPNEVVGAIQQGERHVILLAEDVAATALSAPAINDRVIWNGKTLTVKEVNDATRRIRGVAIAYDLKVQGA